MKRLFFLIALFLAIQAHAQENTEGKCNDGIDNDGDGFVDCYDKECYTKAVCKDFFIGKDASCDAKPDSFPPFGMRLKYKSNNGSNNLNRLIAGDVDMDGIPEIVTTYRKADKYGKNTSQSFINIFQAPASGTMLTLDKQIDIFADGFNSSYEDIAMADIDKDGCAEIFVLTSDSDGNGFRIIAYDCKGVKKWDNPIVYDFYPGTMGLADFDGDGFVELYTRTQIFDAHSGVKMGENNIDGVGSTVNWGKNSNAPIAVDILSSFPGLELVAGCRIYSVSINRPSPPPFKPTGAAVITLQNSRSDYFTRTGRATGSGTSVADFNQDGFLDVIAVGSLNGYDLSTTIFFWDVHNGGALKSFTDAFGSGSYANGWKNGAGRVNLADIDGDTLMNAVYVSGEYLYALKEGPTSLEQVFKESVTENTSGYTGCTMFDFNADGKSEIVYRDEENLYIYTTTNIAGVVKVTKSIGQACKSRTSNEYPIVVDMDADGHSEICVTCATDESKTGANHDLFDDAEVRVFESNDPAAPWVPARRLWNQHGYFIVNVNDDLTIPKHQQASEKIFADGAPCRKNGKSRPFNSFLNQAPFLNSFGCPQYAAPNLSFDSTGVGKLKVIAPTCPEKDYTISFGIKNEGNLAISGDVPVSFYSKNPTKPGALKYNTVFVKVKLLPDGTQLTGNLTVKGTGSPDSLYIVLNDAGTSIPVSPIQLPNTKFTECNYDGFYAALVTPKPVPIITATTDDIQCSPNTSPHNGSASAKILIKGIDKSADFNFYWTNGPVSNPAPADYTGALYTGLTGGNDYSVFAVHKTVTCGSDPTTVVTIPLTAPDPPTVTITPIHDYDNCDTPNGVLKAVVNGGDPASKFKFEWYESTSFLTGTIISYSDTARVLKPISYSVNVTDLATGCSNFKDAKVLDKTPELDVTAVATPIDCSNALIGKLASTVTIDGTPVGNTSSYDFNWFKGKTVKPTPDFTTKDLSGLGVNDYTLFVFDNVSKCYSDTITQAITKTTPPKIVSISQTSKQTSCNPLLNTGAAEVIVDDVSKYNFQWFDGQGLTSAISGETNPTIAGLKKGIYTIQVTDRVTKCSATAEVTIDQDTTPLTITTIPKTNSTCAPKSGEVKVTVSQGAVTDYTYFLDDGKTIPVKQQNGDNVFIVLDAQTYNVWAINNTTNCQTDTKPAKVTNTIPVIATTPSNIPAADCKNSQGTLMVSASGGGNNFKFEWYKGGDTSGTPITGATGTTTSSQVVTKYGNYTVKITDISSGCITEKPQFLPIANSHILDIMKTDIDKCAPILGGDINASLTITTTAPGFTYSQSDYTMLVYAASDDPDPDIDSPNGTVPYITLAGSGAPGVPVTKSYSLAAVKLFNDEFYTVVAVSKLAGSPTENCRVSSTVRLNRVTTNPIINDVTTNNLSCDLANPNGTIQLNLGGNPDSPTDVNPANYTIVWNDGAANLPAYANKDLADKLKSGSYTAIVTLKPTEVNGGCTASKVIPILDVPQLLALETDTTSITNCNVATGNPKTEGKANVIKIVIDGDGAHPVSNPFTNHSFAWTTSAGVPVPAPVPGEASLLPAGSYNVVVTNTVSNCKQNASFTIDDKTLGTVAVSLAKFRPEIKCIEPQISHLEIKASTSGINTLGYDYAWYNIPAVLTSPSDYPLKTTIYDGLTAGEKRAIKVINKDNGCWAVDTYEMTGKVVPIRINASSVPLTHCDVSDAELHAVHILPEKYSNDLPIDDSKFNFFWYFNGVLFSSDKDIPNAGMPVLNKTDFENKKITVKAVDKLDATCISDILTVFIQDDRTYPIVTAKSIAPISNCDLTPNGIASANVEGDSIHYAFDWYDVAQKLPIGSLPFYTGSSAADLKAGVAPVNAVYTVVARDIVTQCSDTTSIQLQAIPLTIKNPQVDVLSDVTNCNPDDPNGSLTASVEGNTVDYTFTWTKVGDTGFSERTMVTIEQLQVGTYKVVALDNYSKCTSDTTGVVGIYQVVPEFGITQVDASCSKDDGFAAIYLTNSETLTIDKIEWTDLKSNLIIATGNVVSQILAGSYNVKVTTDRGCVTDKDFIIKTDIHPYNGISRNGDGKNDFFYIDCIDNFPDNVVRVYNRIGTLVYEAHGYDNLGIKFDAQSNKGISVLGTNLPDGTYFYVVDKHDGSKQLAGYLEIVN